MKKLPRRIWTRILTGLALILGVSSCIGIHTPKLYGPPPAELYGPPTPEMEVDSTTNTVNEIEEE